jgi:hypothetical protein
VKRLVRQVLAITNRLFRSVRVPFPESDGFLQLHINGGQIMTEGVMDFEGNTISLLGGGNGLLRALLELHMRAFQLGKQFICPYPA